MGTDARAASASAAPGESVIAFSGFFTSWATPAISRPRAASLREYFSVEWTWREVAEVAGDEHGADEAAAAVFDRVRHQQALG